VAFAAKLFWMELSKSLLASGLLSCQWSIAVDVQLGPALHGLGIGERGRRLSQLPFGLVERGLKGTWINLEE